MSGCVLNSICCTKWHALVGQDIHVWPEDICVSIYWFNYLLLPVYLFIYLSTSIYTSIYISILYIHNLLHPWTYTTFISINLLQNIKPHHYLLLCYIIFYFILFYYFHLPPLSSKPLPITTFPWNFMIFLYSNNVPSDILIHNINVQVASKLNP